MCRKKVLGVENFLEIKKCQGWFSWKMNLVQNSLPTEI